MFGHLREDWLAISCSISHRQGRPRSWQLRQYRSKTRKKSWTNSFISSWVVFIWYPLFEFCWVIRQKGNIPKSSYLTPLFSSVCSNQSLCWLLLGVTREKEVWWHMEYCGHTAHPSNPRLSLANPSQWRPLIGHTRHVPGPWWHRLESNLHRLAGLYWNYVKTKIMGSHQRRCIWSNTDILTSSDEETEMWIK